MTQLKTLFSSLQTSASDLWSEGLSPCARSFNNLGNVRNSLQEFLNIRERIYEGIADAKKLKAADKKIVLQKKPKKIRKAV